MVKKKQSMILDMRFLILTHIQRYPSAYSSLSLILLTPPSIHNASIAKHSFFCLFDLLRLIKLQQPLPLAVCLTPLM